MAGDQRVRAGDRCLAQRFARMRLVKEDGDSPPVQPAPQRSDVTSRDDDDRHPGGVQLLGDPEAQVVQPTDDDVAICVTGQDCHPTSTRMCDPAGMDAVCRSPSMRARHRGTLLDGCQPVNLGWWCRLVV